MRAPKRQKLTVNHFDHTHNFVILIDSELQLCIEVSSKRIVIGVLREEEDEEMCRLYVPYVLTTSKHNDFITFEQIANLKLEAFCEDCSNELHDKFIYYLQFIALDEVIWKVNIVCKDTKWFIESDPQQQNEE